MMTASTEPIIIAIPREVVEDGDPTPVLQGLTMFARTAVLAPQALGIMRVGFAGYDNDARELWEIPQVRCFVADLDNQFPYWFYFADLQDESLAALAFCIGRVTEMAPGTTAIDRTDFERFLERQFDGMNSMWERLRLAEAANVARSDAVIEYVSKRVILN